MPWVFDTSITMAWCFVDEKTPETESLLNRLRNEAAVVPAIWQLEVANVLTQAMRNKRRLTFAERAEFLKMLTLAKIEVDPMTGQQAWSATLSLADQYLLSIYDAAYLELAIRLGVELATFDKALRAAATAAGVKVIP